MWWKVRWTLGVVGVFMLVGSGVSIFWRPAGEVLYDRRRLDACTASGCTFLYTLEVGNTGSEAQADIRVRLRAAVMDGALFAPNARDFGKFDRPVRVSDVAGIRTYSLGLLEPEERVELSFVLRGSEREAAPTWEQILVGVEASDGRVRVGNPGWVILLRLWYAIFSAW